jgi:ribonuclease-3
MTQDNTPPHEPPDPARLEETVGHEFRDRVLLERAFTHRSYAHENVPSGEEVRARQMHNEALEFVGDSVLGLVVSEALFRDHPEVTEGELSRMKHRLVSTQTLARASRRLGLGEHLRVGRGEEKTGGRRKRALLADVFEALLAAIYLDGGLDAARGFVERALAEEFAGSSPEAAAAADYKTLLQERLQAEQRVTPVYEVAETEGPPHNRVFHVDVCWHEERIRGRGGTIKSAEMDAARRALEQLGAPRPEEAAGARAAADDEVEDEAVEDEAAAD